MDDDVTIEARISDLTSELGMALFPRTREIVEEELAHIADDTERMRAARDKWLSFLEFVKREKDGNSTTWQKMRNWD
jgi:hypothetical protein